MTETTQLILAKMDELLAMGGAKISEFYPFLLKQQYVVAFGEFVGLAISTVLCLVSLKIIRMKWDYIYKQDCTTTYSVFQCFLSSMVGIIEAPLSLRTSCLYPLSP